MSIHAHDAKTYVCYTITSTRAVESLYRHIQFLYKHGFNKDISQIKYIMQKRHEKALHQHSKKTIALSVAGVKHT